MSSHPVAVAPDIEYGGRVQEAVDNCPGDHLIGEDLPQSEKPQVVDPGFALLEQLAVAEDSRAP